MLRVKLLECVNEHQLAVKIVPLPDDHGDLSMRQTDLAGQDVVVVSHCALVDLARHGLHHDQLQHAPPWDGASSGVGPVDDAIKVEVGV